MCKIRGLAQHTQRVPRRLLLPDMARRLTAGEKRRQSGVVAGKLGFDAEPGLNSDSPMTNMNFGTFLHPSMLQFFHLYIRDKYYTLARLLWKFNRIS